MINVCILGASGSIGTQAIDVLKSHRDLFNLVSFSVGSNIEYAKEILKEFPEVEYVCTKDKIEDINHSGYCYGDEGLIKCCTQDSVDIVLSSVVGFVGLLPTIKAIESKKNIALANKETLVVAGHIIMPLAKKYGVEILPVDSEHSAIFQSLANSKNSDVNKLIITASGGSFRDKSREELKNVSVSDALNHPNWSMGKKITIDSATMFNKGLEVIEAHHLFDIDYNDIDVLIHNQSIIHSMVEFNDYSVIAQLGNADMRLPIIYALSNKQRIYTKNFNQLDLAKVARLDFKNVDYKRYPALKLCFEVGKKGHSFPTVLNAANEIAVDLFLNNKIKFLDIEEIVQKAVDLHNIVENPNIDEIIVIDQQTRKFVLERYEAWIL